MERSASKASHAQNTRMGFHCAPWKVLTQEGTAPQKSRGRWTWLPSPLHFLGVAFSPAMLP